MSVFLYSLWRPNAPRTSNERRGTRTTARSVRLRWAICLIPLLYASVLGEVVPVLAADAPISRQDLHALLVVNPDTIKQTQTYGAISNLPASDDNVIVPWLRANVDRLQPLFLYELARRVFPADHTAGLEWYALATIRTQYDARRCADSSVVNGAMLLIHPAKPIPAYARAHHDQLLAAFRRALARRDVFVDNISPRWICIHGIAAFSAIMSGKEPPLRLQPRSKWPQIREQILRETAQAARARQRPILAAGLRVLRELRLTTVVDAMAWSSDGRLIATLSDFFRQVTVWDAAAGHKLRAFRLPFPFATALAFTPDGKYLLTGVDSAQSQGSPYAAALWDANDGRLVRRLAAPLPQMQLASNAARNFAFSPDGRFLALIAEEGLDLPVVLYDTATWTIIAKLPIPRDIPVALAFSPDSRTLCVGTTGGDAIFFNLLTRQEMKTLNIYPPGWGGIMSLAYSADGRYLAVGPGLSPKYRIIAQKGQLIRYPNTNGLQIWDVARQRLVGSSVSPVSAMYTISWAPGAGSLLAVNDHRTVRLWRRGLKDAGRTLITFDSAAYAAQFAPDGKSFAAAGDDEVLIVNLNNQN